MHYLRNREIQLETTFRIIWGKKRGKANRINDEAVSDQSQTLSSSLVRTSALLRKIEKR